MDATATAPSDAPDKHQPEKYVRTFAGDMDVLKAGGIPELAPLAPQQRAAPKERPTMESPLAPPSALSLTPSPQPEPPPAPASAPPVAPIETYASDFSDRMKETQASAATVLAAEQDSAPRSLQAIPEKSSRSGRPYIIAGILLLIMGGSGTYIAYTRYLSARAPVIPAPSVPAPIFVDEREQVSGTGPALLEAIKQSAGRPLAPNAVRLLYTIDTAESVFSALPASAPDVLLRNVDASGSMAGVVRAGDSQSPFFILSVSSYSTTFAGMLSWEAVMPRALGSLFAAYPPPIVSTTTATTTQSTAGAAHVSGFRDEVVGNHDARVYRDEAGRSVMLYGYWNQTTLVIARDPAAFIEIFGRLATSRVLQ